MKPYLIRMKIAIEGQCVSIDLTDYPFPPVEQILGFLVWMMNVG
ncbi:hypothetical protein [Scytonema hofmannii]|nr:hypothetical protein [Scytonema hofmannii]